MESEHTQINLNDGKLEISWGKSKNTDFLEKYRPITDHFSEKVCITDQNYLYRPSCHHCISTSIIEFSKLPKRLAAAKDLHSNFLW